MLKVVSKSMKGGTWNAIGRREVREVREVREEEKKESGCFKADATR